jgi:hypothetical protein
MLEASVTYFVFNRPRLTEKTFSVLREQKVPKLFIVADGPRSDVFSDVENCAAVRLIVGNIDWPCEVYYNFSNINLGLKKRIGTGLDWVFSRVEKTIILEDDCLAHPDFFKFCDELLIKYADTNLVSVITGNNFQNGRVRGLSPYYFSKYPHCWGWATWRRAWSNYDQDILFWPEWKKSKEWNKVMPDQVERQYWESIFDAVYSGGVNSWAYPWVASIWHQNGLTATPNSNLVMNIGFGEDATHTKSNSDMKDQIPLNSMEEIFHPKVVECDLSADRYAFDRHFGGWHFRQPWKTFLYVARTIKSICPKIIK